MDNSISSKLKSIIIKCQKLENEAYLVYTYLSEKEKNETNKNNLIYISNIKYNHYCFCKKYTQEDSYANTFKVSCYKLISRILGFTFALKLFEQIEVVEIKYLKIIIQELPEFEKIMEDKKKYENILIDLLEEDRLQYIGAIVLGLNDALVELTGTMAGLTFALSSTRLVALSGIVTGLSATLSMAASNYLAQRADGNPNAFKSSVYTGIAYFITVIFMILPYLLLPVNMYYMAFGIMMMIVIVIILFFNYYVSVVQSLPFLRRFLEMTGISLGVAFISFIIGLVAKRFLGID